MNDFILKRVLALLFGWFAIIGAALAADFQPASIGNHENSLANRIQFPEFSGDFTVFVRCEAKVMPAGGIDEIGCYSEEKVDDAFYRAVHLAAANASVQPASVDGENVNVLMLFSVIFRQQGNERVLAVVPNHGSNAKDLGVSYIAPQKYGYSINYRPRTELGLLWIDARMDAQGRLSEVSYLDTQWSNAEARRYAKNYVKEARFIPGFVDGKPAAMRFVKPIFGYRNGFMWDTDDSFCRDSMIACDETSKRTGRPRYLFDD